MHATDLVREASVLQKVKAQKKHAIQKLSFLHSLDILTHSADYEHAQIHLLYPYLCYLYHITGC